MNADWFAPVHGWVIDNTLLSLAFALIVANWKQPIVRNLAVLNFVVGLVGVQFIHYISQLPTEEMLYFKELTVAIVNLSKVLLIILLISLDIRYLCRVSSQLIGVFTLIGLLDVAHFMMCFVFGSSAGGSGFDSFYSVMIPALNMMALFVLAAPFVMTFFTKTNGKHSSI